MPVLEKKQKTTEHVRNEKSIALAITQLNEAGIRTPTNRRIAKQAGVSLNTVRRHNPPVDFADIKNKYPHLFADVDVYIQRLKDIAIGKIEGDYRPIIEFLKVAGMVSVSTQINIQNNLSISQILKNDDNNKQPDSSPKAIQKPKG